eukprot:38267-Rhodomonas_salina.1
MHDSTKGTMYHATTYWEFGPSWLHLAILKQARYLLAGYGQRGKETGSLGPWGGGALVSWPACDPDRGVRSGLQPHAQAP